MPNMNDIPQEIAEVILQTVELDDKNFRLEPFTIIVKDNGPDVTDLKYHFPFSRDTNSDGSLRQVTARKSTWQFFDTTQLQIGRCYVFLAFTEYKEEELGSRGNLNTKKPLLILESVALTDMKASRNLSYHWDRMFRMRTQSQFIEFIFQR